MKEITLRSKSGELKMKFTGIQADNLMSEIFSDLDVFKRGDEYIKYKVMTDSKFTFKKPGGEVEIYFWDTDIITLKEL